MMTHSGRARGGSPATSSPFPCILPFLQSQRALFFASPLPQSTVLRPFPLSSRASPAPGLLGIPVLTAPPLLGSAFGPCFFMAVGLDELKINLSQPHNWGTVSCFLSPWEGKGYEGPMQPPRIRSRAPQGVGTSPTGCWVHCNCFSTIPGLPCLLTSPRRSSGLNWIVCASPNL